MKMEGSNFLRKAKTAALGVLALGLSSKANAENTADTLSKKDNQTNVASAKSFEDSTKNINTFKMQSAENKNQDLTKKFEFKQLTEKQMQDWNKFIDFVEFEGYKGSPELNKSKEVGYKLFDKFKKLNPEIDINLRDPSLVASVQMEIQKFAENARAFARRKNNPNAENLMTGISQVDDFAGPKTLQYKFATAVLDKYHNDNLVSTHDLGMVKGDLTSTRSILEKKMEKRSDGNFYHKGKKAELMSDGKYYVENDDGDLVMLR